MCEPATIAAATAWASAHAGALMIASTAMAAGSSVMQFANQSAQSKAMNVNAKSAYETQVSGITDRQMQEQSAAAQRTFQNQREYDAARATAITGAENSGLHGLSVDGLLNDLVGQQHERQDAVAQNTTWSIRAMQQEKMGAAASRDSRMNSAPMPSALGLGLTIGGQSIVGLDRFSKATDPKRNLKVN